MLTTRSALKIAAVVIILGATSFTHSYSKTRLTAAPKHRRHEPSPSAAIPPSISITGQMPNNPTPFIATIQLHANQPTAVDRITFTIASKSGSVTRPISATYTSAYMQKRGYFNTASGDITLPVFGLYANYSNTVALAYQFGDGSVQQDQVTVPTGAFTHPCGLDNPTVLQARTSTTDLSYDHLLLKSSCAPDSPTVLDTDGAVRWVGTANIGTLAAIFFDDGFYLAGNATGSSNVTGLTRLELDGTSASVADYNSVGVVNSGHHNIDPGKYGMLLEVSTTSQNGAVVLEVDACGNVLKTWNLADIISAAMTAGGDDPTQFVRPSPTDWFHNNAVTYRKSDDTLVVSGREDFVIALDYETGTIKWILGDTTKKWAQFPTLLNYALALGADTLPPIGEHGVSFSADDDLLLFDNGLSSQNQSPKGADRTYSAPRKYHVDLQNKVATEVWNYPNGQSLYTPICSSIYEDAPLNYVIDYAALSKVAGQPLSNSDRFNELLGLTAAGDKVFDYRYQTTYCATAWNVIPLHWEHLLLDVPNPDNLQVGSFELSTSKNVIIFTGVAGKTYRLEYKSDLADTDWQTVGDLTATCDGPTMLSDTSVTDQTQRFYRVERIDPTPGRSG
jgi:arylsulfate sulfotransferase